MTDRASSRTVLVTGATGFVGRALLPALVRDGVLVRATSRREGPPGDASVSWVKCDVADRDDLARALDGVHVAYFLVHGMGGGHADYATHEAESARLFAEVAAERGVERIVYLGGVAPEREPSVHLKSRLTVGEVLREGRVPTLELRASMIVGAGSASWKLVRDLAFRLPAMVLPKWTRSSTCPVAIDDVVGALVAAKHVPLERSAWFDLPGPEVLTGAEVLFRLAALQGRAVPAIPVPLLSPSLSSWWLRLVTGADFSLARELVLGFTSDLLPRDDRYWQLIGAPPRLSFDEAALRALTQERAAASVRGVLGETAEFVVRVVGQGLAYRRQRR
ncbi:MAG: NAD(P)H-binding protein [Myxococcaceae bacterium]|nr:NAD(P)H-binding protein [Myxococcaceae bacterium]